MNSRDEIIDTISRVVTMELPGITTEADRRAKLGVICMMTCIQVGEDEWHKLWADVMDRTGCGSWDSIMNKGKH